MVGAITRIHESKLLRGGGCFQLYTPSPEKFTLMVGAITRIHESKLLRGGGVQLKTTAQTCIDHCIKVFRISDSFESMEI